MRGLVYKGWLVLKCLPKQKVYKNNKKSKVVGLFIFYKEKVYILVSYLVSFMKTLNIPFEDWEFEQIKKSQQESGLTWRQYILHITKTKQEGEE